MIPMRFFMYENKDDKNEIFGDIKYLNKVKADEGKRPTLGLRQGTVSVV